MSDRKTNPQYELSDRAAVVLILLFIGTVLFAVGGVFTIGAGWTLVVLGAVYLVLAVAAVFVMPR